MESSMSDQTHPRPQKYLNLNALSEGTLIEQHDQNSPHFASSPQIASHVRGGFQRESADLYFLRDSADGFRRNNALTPDGSQPISWQEQKEMLLSMLTKNQDLATNMQQKLEEEISEHERKYETDTSDLRKEISMLKQENKILKELPLNQSQLNLSASSLNSDTKTKNFIESLRSQLIGEIQRLERAYAEREADLQNQNQRLYLQLGSREEAIMKMKEQLQIHEEVAQKSITDLGLEKGSEINLLRSKIKELEYENKSLEQQITSRDQQLWHLQKKEEEEGQRSKKKETVAGEREKLLKAISRNVELIKEKQDIFKDKIAHLERELQISKQEMKDKLNTLFHEKNKTEQALSTELALKTEELTKVKKLLQKLKQSSAELIETSKIKEKTKQAETNALKAENAELRNRCLELEKQYDGERSTLKNSLQEYQQLLTQAESRLQKGWDQSQSMVHNLEKQVSQLLQQSQIKDRELQKLRKKVLELETQDRTKITKMIAFSQQSLNDLEARQSTLLEDYAKLQRELLQSDESHTRLELSDSQKLNEVLQELAEVKFQLQQAHASKLNEQNQELKQSLVFMQAELDHAKKNLVAYMQTVSQLEDKIQIRYQKGDTTSLKKEVEKLKLQIMRLNEENQGLANAKNKIESMYADRIEELQTNLFQKSTAFSALHSKYIKLQQTGCYLREEELLAWKKRQETVKNLLKRLNHQVEDFRFQRNTIQKLKKHDAQMMIQQLEEYKKSSGKVEEFWKQQHASWATQNETLRSQLQAMSSRVETSSKYYKEMGSLLEREKENYKKINLQLQRRARIPVSNGVNQFTRSEESFRAEKMQLSATINNLQKQVQVLNEQFHTAAQEQERQAEAREKASADKLAIAKAKEVAALSQVATLKQSNEEQY